MSIPNYLIDLAKADSLRGAGEICKYALNSLADNQDWTEDEYEVLLEATALILSLKENSFIQFARRAPDVEGNTAYACNEMRDFLFAVEQDLAKKTSVQRLESMKNRFSNLLSSGFGYEFTDGDLARIRTLINELREHIIANKELDDEHKRRLLGRLEKMQAEIHKKMSDLSVFYGLLVEGSVVLKKVGENAKPIVDRIKELTTISWGTQARAENLPSGTEPPMIENDSDSQA